MFHPATEADALEILGILRSELTKLDLRVHNEKKFSEIMIDVDGINVVFFATVSALGHQEFQGVGVEDAAFKLSHAPINVLRAFGLDKVVSSVENGPVKPTNTSQLASGRVALALQPSDRTFGEAQSTAYGSVCTNSSTPAAGVQSTEQEEKSYEWWSKTKKNRPELKIKLFAQDTESPY